MDILQYSDLDISRVREPFERIVTHLRSGDFRAADVKKLSGTPFYRAKLDHADRLLFRFARHSERTVLLLLEVIYGHAYNKSRFLNGAQIDDAKLEPVVDPLCDADSTGPAALKLNYVNIGNPHFHLLDKVLSFDDIQEEVIRLTPPLIVIGSAGSGKTALMIEKLKLLQGEALYVTLSPFLVENARNLYYANHYENDRVEVDFLSYKELLQTLLVHPGRELVFRDFEHWFARHRQASGIKDSHQLFEEFRGVLTGAPVDRPYLSRDAYMQLGVKQSIFFEKERAEAYTIFDKYLAFLNDSGCYDSNILSWQYLPNVRPAYDFVVIDEVQDLTNVQIYLILKHLRGAHNFILGGDANQIVHPNFFHWSQIKTLFYLQRDEDRREIIRILHTNYRNSPEVTDIANRLLLIKNARFGSIDRESNFLVRCISENKGEVTLLASTSEVLRSLNEKTRKSTRFAVIVLREEDKAAARQHFTTPLVFSIQEAKGLEYENIILLNFISSNSSEFLDIVEGVTIDQLQAEEMKYSRAKDKSDKSAEAYKFFINALYVAVTRAVRNLYVVERDHRHRLIELLSLKQASERVQIAMQESSKEDWQREARRLELQGKQEQAELIRRDLLGNQPVPWRVLTKTTLDELKKEALNPDHFNKQAKNQLFEYAIVYGAKPLIQELASLKYSWAISPSKADMDAVARKYRQDYYERSYPNLKRKIQLHGIDFRNPLNQTPLMIAAQMGIPDLVKALLSGGSDPELRDNWGRTAFQNSLRQAYLDKNYALAKIGHIYDLLAPSSLKVQVDGRLIKLDRSMMEFFLLQSMLSVFQEILREKIQWRIPAFETADFIFALEHFPEHVIPERRRIRSYITNVLSRNEVMRQDGANRKLFVRAARGFYLPNPRMEIQTGETWQNIYDVINLDALEQEKDNQNLQNLVRFIRKLMTQPFESSDGQDKKDSLAHENELF
jgi:superfamily I DNA/RNA helicase